MTVDGHFLFVEISKSAADTLSPFQLLPMQLCIGALSRWIAVACALLFFFIQISFSEEGSLYFQRK